MDFIQADSFPGVAEFWHCHSTDTKKLHFFPWENRNSSLCNELFILYYSGWGMYANCYVVCKDITIITI